MKLHTKAATDGPLPIFFQTQSLLRFLLRASYLLSLALLIGMSAYEDLAKAGLEVLQLPFHARLAEAIMSVVSIGLVTLVYTLLIQRGSLLATTSLYPRRPIEENIGHILDAAWPKHADHLASKLSKSASRREEPGYMIRLFYTGKMEPDGSAGVVAKGRAESSATPIGEENRRSLWLTSGSGLTKGVVQILIWEWVCLWLVVLMGLSILLFNGFFTNSLSPDSYPRLTVMSIYVSAFIAHFSYVWMVSLRFFRNVFRGAAWSLLERAKFVVGESFKLDNHQNDQLFDFRNIDKANELSAHTTVSASIGCPPPGNPTVPSPAGSFSTTAQPSTSSHSAQGEDPVELRAAIATVNKTQTTERDAATTAVALALDRVIANAMVMVSVTVSGGFAAWTSAQMTKETPNNTATTQIGSLALLGSLALGTAAMFTSAMHLEIMSSAFRTIVSLKETKINGMAVDHYRKRGNVARSSKTATAGGRPVSFTQETIPSASVGLRDFFAGNRSRGWLGVLGMALFGPAYALLPRLSDHERESAEVEFDFVAELENSGGSVVLTTRPTDRHARKGKDGSNVDPINVCYRTGGFGKETC